MALLDKRDPVLGVKYKYYVLGAVLFILVGGTAGVANIVNQAQSIVADFIGEEGADPTFAREESTVENPVQVTVKMTVSEGIDANTPGLGSGAAANIAIRVMHDNGGKPGNLFKTITASSGEISLGKVYTGTYFWVQARQGAPSAADPYIGPAVQRYVPHEEGIDWDDTIYLDDLYVRDVTATAPTFLCKDSSGAAISDNSANYFNTTDIQFMVMLHTIDADTWYGGENGPNGYIVDYASGDVFEYGVWFIWKGTVTQPFVKGSGVGEYKYSWSDPTNVYYAFKLDDAIFDDSTTGGNDEDISVFLATNGNNLVADATVVLDINDMIQVGTGGVLNAPDSSSALIDGGGVAVTAITTKVA